MPDESAAPPPAKPNTKHGLIGLAIICGVFGLVIYGVASHRSSTSPTGTPSSGQAAASAPPNSAEAEAKRLATMSTAEVRAEVARIIQERAKLNQQYGQIAKDHPSFQINGDIKDRDENSVTIWGLAVPADNDLSRLGTLTNEGNICVIDPDKKGILGGSSYLGHHYFIKKVEGTNAFGAKVPVYVFGAEPKVMSDLQAQYAATKDTYTLVRRFWYDIESKIGKAPALSESGWNEITSALKTLDDIKVDSLGLDAPLSDMTAHHLAAVPRNMDTDYVLSEQGAILTFKSTGEEGRTNAWALTLILNPDKLADYYDNVPKGMKANAAVGSSWPIMQAASEQTVAKRLELDDDGAVYLASNTDVPELWQVEISPRPHTSNPHWTRLIVLSDGTSTNILAISLYHGRPAVSGAALPFTMETQSKDPFKP